MKKNLLLFLIALCVSASLSAQLSIIADSLPSPIGIKADKWGNVWVANVGTGNDDASITLIVPGGKKYIAFNNLPSKLNPLAGDVVGPWRAIPMNYGRMAVLVGGNPTLGENFGKLLFFNMNGYTPGDAPKTLKDTTHSFNVGAFGYATSDNLDSDPFSAVQDEDGHWYITDAGANNILKVSRNGKEMSVFAHFAPFKNPTPVGPPFVDPVPTGIVALPKYGGFLVTTLSGFPFLNNAATIYYVDREGHVSKYLDGLTMLTDIDVDRHGTIYACQFGTFDLASGFNFGSGQIIRIRNKKVLDTIAKGYGPGSGLSLYDSRKFYVTDLFTGRALVGNIPAESVEARELNTPSFNVQVSPNPATDRVMVQWKDLKTTSPVSIQMIDISGKVIYEKKNIDTVWPQHTIDVSRLQAGTYIMNMYVNGQSLTKKLNIVK